MLRSGTSCCKSLDFCPENDDKIITSHENGSMYMWDVAKKEVISIF
jgi:WD40 repeat protein